MAKISSKDAELYLVDGENTETKLPSISDYSTEVSRSTIDCSVMSTEWSDSVVGLASGSGSFTVIYDTADVTLTTLRTASNNGSEVTLKWYPEGKSTGKPWTQYKIYITAFNVSASTADTIKIAVSYTVNGAPTQGTVA